MRSYPTWAVIGRAALLLRFRMLLTLLLTAIGALAQAPPGNPHSSGPEAVLQTGHTGEFIAAALSPDGRWLASGGGDHTVRLWEVATGRELRSLAGHQDMVMSLSFSPDGRWLASASMDHTVRLWEVATGRELRTFVGHGRDVESVAFSPDGRWLASGSMDKTIKLWDAATGRELRTFTGHQGDVVSLAFSPDGRTLASGSWDTTVKLWEVATGHESHTFRGHTGDVTSVAFSPDGRWLASAGGFGDGAVRLWEVATGEQLYLLSGRKSTVRSVVFSPDGRRLIWADIDGRVTLRDLATGAQTQQLRREGAASLRGVTMSADGILLAVVTSFSVELWDVAGSRKLHTLTGKGAWVESVAFSADGRWLASGENDGRILIWDTAAGREARVLTHCNVGLTVSFSPDSRWLASGCFDGVKLWDVTTGSNLLTLEGTATGASSLAFGPDGRWLASTGVGPVVIWDLPAGAKMRTLNGAGSVAVSPDGRSLASASSQGIKLWEADTGRELRALTGHTESIESVAFSPDGRWLASGGFDHTVLLWDLATGRQQFSLTGHSDDVWSVAFSPDSRWLASAGGSGDNAIRLWDVATGRQLRLLAGHTNTVQSVAFSPDGRWLLSGSWDGSIRLWDPATGQYVAALVGMRGSNNWLVVTPDGLFDGSPAAWNQILWRFNNNTFDVAPVETFFREYYYPGLLADILAGKRPRAKTDIANIDRRQPEVKLSLAGGETGTTGPERRVKIEVEVQEAPADKEHAAGSGAQDVRLFRNGSLVKMWHGEVKLDKDGKATLETEVTLVAGENRFTTYAFNHDNIKSSDAALTVTGADALKRPGTAYILAVGINQYASADFNLRYAAADALDFAQEIEAQQKKVGRYAKVEITSLQDAQATKANLLAALQHLAEVAQPEDAVFIYYAGHGTAAGARFYLIPHDLGYAGSREQLDEAAVKSVLAHSVSDLELGQAFEGIDAGELVLVIDACRSGQALAADDPRQGPMNSKGLAQLAYEKGMYILTASQGYQAALEASSYGHGLLTYALVEEGLKSAKADDEPQDGQITLREWLDYASQEVPQLELQLMQAARTRGMDVAIVEGEQKVEEVEKRSLQRPRVFYRREPEATPFVVAKP